MSAINNLPGLAKFNNATHETDGLMSRNDKEKLDTLHKAVTIHKILYASEWSQNRPYSQKIDLPDITSETNGTLTIDPSATDDEIDACIDADIIIAEQSINSMTLQVTGTKPDIDIPVIIIYGENLAIVTSPSIVDTGNHVYDVIIQPSDWLEYKDIYKASLNISGLNSSVVGSISMKSGIEESEADIAAKARLEIENVFDDTLELVANGEKPNIPLHVTVYFGPSIAVVRRPVFGGKITPHAMYQEFDDSKTGLGVTKTQNAIEKIINGTTGLNNKATHFKTVDLMKQTMSLKVGQLVTTSGYRESNDGGGATYLITSNSLKSDNGGSVHVLANGLRAEIVLALGEDINLKCFGLYADGIHDDTPAFKRGFDFCKQIKGGTVRWQGIAAINEPLVVDSHYINIQGYGYGSIIKANTNRDYVLAVTYEQYSTTEEIQQILIGNFRINGNRVAKHGLLIDDNLPIYNSIFENIFIHDTLDSGLVADSCKNCQFNLITVDTCYGGIKIIDSAYNLKFDNCRVQNISEGPITTDDSHSYLLHITSEELESTDNNNSEITNRPSSIQFNGCYFGNSECYYLIQIDKSIDIDFDRCSFTFSKLIESDNTEQDSTRYPIILKEYALYTRFTDCFLYGSNKNFGMIKSSGPETTIRNFKAIDIKSMIHILVYDNIHINGLKLLGDSTPFVIYTPNEDKSIIDIDSVIKPINDDTLLFEDNANYYNFYMNQSDKLGVKGKLNNYIIDTYLENDYVEQLYTVYNSPKLEAELTLPESGVWEIDMLLTVSKALPQGIICKYQFTFKQNSPYSVKNVQKLINPIIWGSNIEMTEPTLDEYGNIKLLFSNNNKTDMSPWNLKFKAKRIMSFTIPNINE